MKNDNFLIAVVLSIAILVGFHYLYEKPQMEQFKQQQATKQLEVAKAEAKPQPVQRRPREEVLGETRRLPLKTPTLTGSINLKGARIDDLRLERYRESVDADAKTIVLLAPAGSYGQALPTFVSFGWLGEGVALPTDDTVWSTSSKELAPGKPAVLTWDNGQGIVFERTIGLDDKYMFTVTDRVTNKSANGITLYPFGAVARQGKPVTQDIYIMHEGPQGVLGGTLKEAKYKDLMASPRETFDTEGGWVGMTDKYWLVSLILPKDEKGTATFTYDRAHEEKPEDGSFQTDFRGSPLSLAPGATADHTMHLFAGAKEVRTLDRYEDQLQIPLFDRAIDFGWYYYLTKPFLYLLESLGSLTGNMGIAILIFTVILKLLTLPLSLKSYRSMAKMKAIQPQLVALQERYKSDKARLSMETMELYKREKVSPVSGCLPSLIQVPIFFALYKVLYVGLELRQAPFYGWIKDLSVPDPTSVLTAFGHIDFALIPHIGVWPILMGLSMYVQQKLTPQPVDKSQAKMFAFLPLIFTFMMAKVAAGLIIYWTWSNLLGLGQQWLIMHKTRTKKA